MAFGIDSEAGFSEDEREAYHWDREDDLADYNDAEADDYRYESEGDYSPEDEDWGDYDDSGYDPNDDYYGGE